MVSTLPLINLCLTTVILARELSLHECDVSSIGGKESMCAKVGGEFV